MALTRIRRFILNEASRVALATESAKTGIPMEALAGAAVLLASDLKGPARERWHELARIANELKLKELKGNSHK